MTDTLGGLPQDGGDVFPENPGRREFLKQGVILSAATVLGLTGASGALAENNAPTKAIQFEFLDRKGNTIKLKDLQGKWVIVNFWMPSCSMCKTQIEELKQIDGTKSSDGRDIAVVYIALNYDGLFDNVDTSISLLGLQDSRTVLGGKSRAPDSPVRQVGPVDFFPTSYMYNPNGEIVAYGPGKRSPEWINKIISQFSPGPSQRSEKIASRN